MQWHMASCALLRRPPRRLRSLPSTVAQRVSSHNRRGLSSTSTTADSESMSTGKNILFLAPVALSGLLVAGIMIHLTTSKAEKTNKANPKVVDSDLLLSSPTSSFNDLSNSSSTSPGSYYSASSGASTSSPPTGSRRKTTLEIPGYSKSGMEVIMGPRSIWSVGEKVDKKQFKERYEEITSDKNGLHMIGRGAYGRVLSAVTKNSGQKVAMKVVSPNQMSAQALSREVEVLRRVRGHDHVIHLLEVLEFNGSWYLVTELCEGGDLLDRLITNGPYDEATCSAVVYNAASALDHVHRCGFVHFDVKPENLVFVTTGGTQRDVNASDVRLIDFGMAKDLASIEKHGGTLLRSSSSVVEQLKSNPNIQPPRVGTIAYWAPEQIIAGNATNEPGKKEMLLKTDPRACDAWALGVVMYIMLFGCHPFDVKGEGDEKQIAHNILHTRARFDVHGDRVVLSSDARDVIVKLLEPDPTKRIKLSELMNHPFFAEFKHFRSGDSGDGSSTTTTTPTTKQPQQQEQQQQQPYNKRNRLYERLPTSWKKAGFVPVRTAADDAIDDPVNTFRFAPFKTLEANQALVQALLLASVATAEEEEDQFRNSDSLFRAAFDALDVNNQGVITAEAMNSFAQALKQGTAESGDAIAAAMERAASRMSIPATETDLSQLEGQPYITFDEFQALLRSNLCVSRAFNPGEVIFEQGALPQGVYLLVSGQAKVEWRSPVVKPQQSDPAISHIEAGFATIPPGSIIGETAIIQGRLQRSATIRMAEKSQVVYIPKQEFLLAVATSKALSEKIAALTNEQQARRVFQFFDNLKQEGKLVNFHQGQVIFKQSESADSLYLIRKGVVELAVRGQSSNQEGAQQIHVRVGRRRQGDVVGVSAIHPFNKRSTSATCLTDVEALKIDSETLVTLLERYPILRFYIESQKRWRNENWQKMLSDVERGVSEPQILPMLGEGVEEDQGKSFEAYQKALTQADLRDYRAGEYVFRRGERSGELFVIESGRCDVEIRNQKGQVMTITQLGPGDHIGEQALLDGRPQYAFTVRCVTPVVLRALSEKQFFNLLGDRGHSNFARVVRVAMRQRRHLWVARMLNLAHEDGIKPQVIALEPDQPLFRVGEPIDRLYFVHRGSFVVTKPDGSVVRTMAAGETIGWEVFREGGAVCDANATCVTRAVVEALPKEELEGLIQSHRYVSKELEHAATSIVPDFSSSGATQALVRRRSVAAMTPSSASSTSSNTHNNNNNGTTSQPMKQS